MSRFYKNETNLTHLMTPMNSYFPPDQMELRALKDGATSAFCDTFIADENSRNIFIDYTYNYIYSHIMLNINNEMTKSLDGCHPLHGNENIHLVFKGGNVMSMLFDKTSMTNEKMNNLKKYFKPSDVDYSLYIKTETNSRYMNIKHHAKILLMQALEKVAKFFDGVYLEERVPHVVDDMYRLLDTVYDKSRQKMLLKILTLHRMTYNLFLQNAVINSPIFADALFKEQKMLRAIIELIECHKCSIISLTYLHQLCELYLFFNEKLGVRKITDVASIVQKKTEAIDSIQGKLHILENSLLKFYDKKMDIKNNIVAKINEIKDEKFYDYDINSYPQTKRLFTLENDYANKIFLEKKKYLGIYSKNSHTEFTTIVNSNDAHDIGHHYLSYNNTLAIMAGNGMYFDLARIKFFVKIKNGIKTLNDDTIKDINIPSEFIDVSIPHFDDSSKLHFYETIAGDPPMIDIVYQIDGTNYVSQIYSYDKKMLADDLNNVLFHQVSVPWTAPKYEKRLMRLLFFISTTKRNIEAYNVLFKFSKFVKKIMDNGVEIKYFEYDSSKQDTFHYFYKIMSQNFSEKKGIFGEKTDLDQNRKMYSKYFTETLTYVSSNSNIFREEYDEYFKILSTLWTHVFIFMLNDDVKILNIINKMNAVLRIKLFKTNDAKQNKINVDKIRNCFKTFVDTIVLFDEQWNVS